jgi:hypothetical protein
VFPTCGSFPWEALTREMQYRCSLEYVIRDGQRKAAGTEIQYKIEIYCATRILKKNRIFS